MKMAQKGVSAFLAATLSDCTIWGTCWTQIPMEVVAFNIAFSPKVSRLKRGAKKIRPGGSFDHGSRPFWPGLLREGRGLCDRLRRGSPKAFDVGVSFLRITFYLWLNRKPKRKPAILWVPLKTRDAHVFFFSFDWVLFKNLRFRFLRLGPQAYGSCDPRKPCAGEAL